MADEVLGREDGRGRSARRTARPLVVLVALFGIWWSVAQGLVSSNDGSHVALARALALRHVTDIDPDFELTLRVDVARVGQHVYSDRPPGTAFAALGTAWIGARLDPWMWSQGRTRKRPVVRPAADRYAMTYQTRAGSLAPLARLQGTAWMLACHCAFLGLCGLVAGARMPTARDASPGARTFAWLTLGCASLWGPYSTMLFSHVTAGVMWCAALVAFESARSVQHRGLLLLGGLAMAWAVACEFTLAVPLAIYVLCNLRPRDYVAVLIGAAPIALATAMYHSRAFGHWWAIGYDHGQFEFARDRLQTFSGNPLLGLWTLVGAGSGAGLLAQSPIVVLGVVGAVIRSGWRQWLGVAVWILLLSLHRTPSGGATQDYRYLVPMLPLLVGGLSTAWDRWLAPRHRWSTWLRMAVACLWTMSALLTWHNFFAWRDG